MMHYGLRLVLTFLQFAGLCFLTALAAVFLTERLTGTAYLASLAVLATGVFFVWRWSRDRIDLIGPRD
jgi:hypothetical protein